MSDPGKWNDLRQRVISGFVVLTIGIATLYSGGMPLRLLAVCGCGIMIWELARMSSPAQGKQALFLAAVGAGVIWLVTVSHDPIWMLLLPLPSLIGLVTPRQDRVIFALYAAVIMLTCYAMVAFREGYGLAFMIWLVLVVIASDVLGYFGGRTFGGPKFWPRVSPKKTWSGTVSGWVGAALVGLGAVVFANQPLFIIPLSAITAFAAQLGDIAESAIKRRSGIKDSSQLIPGHGGFLDRFDALIGAAIFILLWGLVPLPLPTFGG